MLNKTLDPVTTIVHDKYYEVTFFSEKANCLTTDLLNQLTKLFKKIKKDNKRSFVVLKNSGDRVFCSGASFDEFKELASKSEKIKYFSKIAELFISIIDCNKVVLSIVNGKSVGGGVGLVAVSDYVIANNLATIKLSELSVGLAPFIIGPLIERKIGISNLSSLSLSTDWFEPQWCQRVGLYNELTEDILERERSLIEKFSSYPVQALITWRKALWKSFHDKNRDFKKLLLLKAKESATI